MSETWKSHKLKEANQDRLSKLANALEALADEVRQMAQEEESVKPEDLSKKVSDIVYDYADAESEVPEISALPDARKNPKDFEGDSTSWKKSQGRSWRTGKAFKRIGIAQDKPKAPRRFDADASTSEKAIEEYEKEVDDLSTLATKNGYWEI